jgi:hypothetical protein
VLATTYVRVEPDGTKTYSDRPMAGGQPVELEPAQSYSAPEVDASRPNLPREQRLVQQVDNFQYEVCALAPANDSTFTNPENVPVSLALNPPLRVGDVITMSVDGQMVGGQSTLTYVLAPAHRGTHTVAVTIKDNTGRVVCSASTAFHVMRPGLNSPARR